MTSRNFVMALFVLLGLVRLALFAYQAARKPERHAGNQAPQQPAPALITQETGVLGLALAAETSAQAQTEDQNWRGRDLAHALSLDLRRPDPRHPGLKS